jgi:diguanylate cyclase (GGDEF)-like protein
MSIRTKILLGCLALTVLTGMVGLFAGSSERALGALTSRIYDRAFMSMSYLRSAQNAYVVAADRGGPAPEDARAIAEDLTVAEQRAMSPEGARAAASLRAQIEGRGAPPSPAEARAVAEAFDTAVEIFAADAFRDRSAAQALVARTLHGAWLAVAASVAVALAITWLLSRSIVPPLRAAVAVAGAIAEGRLDNAIVPAGGGETGRLLTALATMQASIADKIARINALMEAQANDHAGELAERHARFSAALDNMSQGLTLFDAEDRLIVSNRRFEEMFGTPSAGASAADLLREAGLDRASVGGTGPFARETVLPDGRSIAISRQPVAGGGHVVTYDDVTERRRSEARLAHMARHDSLTGLPNRLLFREQMEYVLARVRRGEGVAVLYLDLDHFKEVNDTLGHSAGDALLQQAASRLLACTRETDMVVRLGGDEFAVVQSETVQPNDSTALARRLLAAMAEPFDLAFPGSGGADHRVTIGTSIGIAVADAALASPDALLKCADMALYRAKADGRGTYRFYEAGMDALVQARYALERDLRAAVAAGALDVFYQPLVATDDRRVEGFEALVRWRHPARGMVSPGEFIPLAEEIGLIGDIGAWVLRRACAEAVKWPGEATVAVNLSPLQFRDHALAETVLEALAASGLPARRLELEITESLLLQDNDSVLAILHEIRALGVRISMDDFGTGFSSLSYLRRFPFDKIKIDQSFVRGLTEQKDCRAIVRAVIGLGRSLGMAVIAEGVETEEQLDMLREEGCRQVQGYLFSPPRPAHEIPPLLRRPVRERLPTLAV